MVLSMPVAPLARMLARSPNPRRVAAWSTTLALHVLVVALLLVPGVPLVIPPPPQPTPIDVVMLPRDAVIAPVPPPPLAPPRPQQLPQAVDPAPVAPPLVVDQSTLPLPVREPLPRQLPVSPLVAPAPAPTSQAIAVASVTPPPYPGIAARRGQQGTVMLRVLIGTDGRPQTVEVERGSGHSALDRAARQHVLEAWRFHPALERGTAVPAWVRVPIAFTLER